MGEEEVGTFMSFSISLLRSKPQNSFRNVQIFRIWKFSDIFTSLLWHGLQKGGILESWDV